MHVFTEDSVKNKTSRVFTRTGIYVVLEFEDSCSAKEFMRGCMVGANFVIRDFRKNTVD